MACTAINKLPQRTDGSLHKSLSMTFSSFAKLIRSANRNSTFSSALLFLDQHHIHRLDGNSHLVADFYAQLIERINRHHRFHHGAAGHTYLDLTHHRPPLDFSYFSFEAITRSDFHGWLLYMV